MERKNCENKEWYNTILMELYVTKKINYLF